MNIFYVHNCPTTAAHMLCDKHIVKMTLETAQLLSTAHRVLDGDERADAMGLYKSTHKSHPSAVWCRSGALEYLWCLKHLNALCGEYRLRYGGKVHKTERLLRPLLLLPKNIKRSATRSEPPACMPDQYKRACTVTSYRLYYVAEKAYFSKWYGDPNNGPDWFYDPRYKTKDQSLVA